VLYEGHATHPDPGDPSRMAPQIATVAELARRAASGGPRILGICLGHQLLGLAAGAETRRLAVGHHGGNHAVLEAATGRVDIGAHNHEVAVLDGPALAAAGYAVSHRDLNDGRSRAAHALGRIASVQFHPEGARPIEPHASSISPWSGRRHDPTAHGAVIGSGPITIGQAAEFDHAGAGRLAVGEG
jgi:carbamoylphosphate synthase small subunit